MRKLLPWDSLPQPIYTALALKPKKKWVKIGGWVLVFALLCYGAVTIQTNMPLALVSLTFSILYSITMVTTKDAALTCRGLEIFLDMKITTQYDFYPWEEINSIVIEDRRHDDYVRLHIGYKSLEKALFFKRSQIKEICAYAKEQNPEIKIVSHDPAPKSSGNARPANSSKKSKRKK